MKSIFPVKPITSPKSRRDMQCESVVWEHDQQQMNEKTPHVFRFAETPTNILIIEWEATVEIQRLDYSLYTALSQSLICFLWTLL